MKRLLALSMLAGLVLTSLAGCPDNEFEVSTWTKHLEDPREADRAVTKLEQLCKPEAIVPLGNAWQEMGKPPNYLQAIISLARPLTPEEADKQNYTDCAKTGRPANWDKALPYLIEALQKVDEANPRSVDSAKKAAEALGEAKLAGGVDALIEFASKDPSKAIVEAQEICLRALGEFQDEKQKIAAALIKIIDREPPPHPKTANKDNAASVKEKYTLFTIPRLNAVRALAELQVPQAAKPLILAMYRTPEIFAEVRRALVASGPSAKDEAVKVLKGQHAEVEQLFKDKKLDKYCGDKGDAAPTECQDVSIKDHYAAIIIGDFYDPETTPVLLDALKRPAKPVYFTDDSPSPNTQHNGIFDALKKIGAPQSAKAVRDIFRGVSAPKRGGEPSANFMTQVLAVDVYPYVARENDDGFAEISKIANDNGADKDSQYHDPLRQQAALSFARMSKSTSDMATLKTLAQKYFDESDKKKKEAAEKHKASYDAAEAELKKAKGEHEKAKKAIDAELKAAEKDTSKSLADIEAIGKKNKAADEVLKEAKKKHRAAVAPYKNAEQASKAYKGFARMFQIHIARIEVASRCGNDLKCYLGTIGYKPADIEKHLKPHISDVASWTEEEKLGLIEAEIERALLEINKKGEAASEHTETLLDHAKSDNRLVRQSILLALPKVAKKPCPSCEVKLEAAIRSSEGKATLGDLNFETIMLRNYFAWAGGKQPMPKSKLAEEAAKFVTKGGEPAPAAKAEPAKAEAPAKAEEAKAEESKAEEKKEEKKEEPKKEEKKPAPKKKGRGR